MLKLLWRERGRPVSRERFLDEVWGQARFPTTRTVDQHVAKLRQKVEANPSNPRHILTAFGVGYRLEAGATPSSQLFTTPSRLSGK